MAKRGPLKGTEVEFVEEVPRNKRYLDDKGHEVPDPMPLEPPIGYKRSPTLAEQIRSMVRGEQLAAAARESGLETFQEADDFEVDDEFDPKSPYEEHFDPPPTWDDQASRLGELMEVGRVRAAERLAKKAGSKKGLPEMREEGEDGEGGEGKGAEE